MSHRIDSDATVRGRGGETSLTRKSILAALTAAIFTASRFVLLAIAARRLEPIGFGQFAYSQWLVDVVFLVTALGANGVAGRYFAEYTADPARSARLRRHWIRWAVVLPVVAAAITAIAALALHLFPSGGGYVVLALWAVSSGWWAMQTAALTGSQRFGRLLAANVAAAVVMVGAALFAPAMGASVEVFLGVMALSSLVALALGIGLPLAPAPGSERRRGSDMPWSSIRRYALNVWVTALLWTLVWSRGELPVVRSFMGDAGVAQYAAALLIFFGAIQAVQLWVGGIAPHLTELLGSGRRAEAVALTRDLSDLQLLLCGLVAIAIAAVGPELMRLAFGASYGTSAESLTVLLVGLVTVSASLQSHLLQIATDAKFTRNVALFGLAVLYVVALLTVPSFGTVGAAVARVLTMWSMFALTYIIGRRQFGPFLLSGRNVLAVALLVAASTIFSLIMEAQLEYRLIAGLVSSATLIASIRGEHGVVAVGILQHARAQLGRLASQLALLQQRF
jgi:O-antigen/teichoic acid export membrane protein